MKIDMRCSEKRTTSPMGSNVYTVVLTSAIPVARLEIETDKATFDAYEVGRHYDVTAPDVVIGLPPALKPGDELRMVFTPMKTDAPVSPLRSGDDSNEKK